MTGPSHDRGGTRGPNVPGPVLFARYAYPPNRLGYCGPEDHQELLETAAARDLAGLSHLAMQFTGAWPYLELIAGCNGLADPLDARVVDAYWIGNSLLARVTPGALAAAVTDRFARQAGPSLAPLVAAAPAGGLAHHSFHVFAVYPWLGLLRAGREGAPLTVMDRCRIRWGRVVAIAGDVATVTSRPLTFHGSRLGLGPPVLEEVAIGAGGTGAAPPVAPGDTVALHWDWVCDVLDPAGLARLQRVTARNLRAVNSLAVPGPAVACGA